MDVEVELDSKQGVLFEDTIDVQSNSVINLEEFTWTAVGQGKHDIWVMCIVDANENESKV